MLQRLEVIDFLRGFSIFTIVLMHLLQSYPIPPFLMAASSFGGAGVHVFILFTGNVWNWLNHFMKEKY